MSFPLTYQRHELSPVAIKAVLSEDLGDPDVLSIERSGCDYCE